MCDSSLGWRLYSAFCSFVDFTKIDVDDKSVKILEIEMSSATNMGASLLSPGTVCLR